MSDEELEKVAKAATPGPWHWVNPQNDEPRHPQDLRASLRTVAEKPSNFGAYSLPDFILDADDVRHEEDAAFIAAFNPATALALLERVRKAEAEATNLNAQLAELERKVLCPNFEHDWAPASTDGANVTQCRRCPASIRSVDFHPR